MFEEVKDYIRSLDLISYIETPFPFLFCIQCSYFTLIELRSGKRWIAIFYAFILSLFGSTMVSVVIFMETPGWLKDSKYMAMFFYVYVALAFLPQFLKNVLNTRFVQAFIMFGTNLSLRFYCFCSIIVCKLVMLF
jgi:hypothetical protein